MSPLTKAFVVLVTILSILLVALVVPFVANNDAQKDQIADLNNELRSAQAAARVNETDDQAALATQTAEIDKYQTLVKTLRAENISLKETSNAKVADLKKAETLAEGLAASQAILSESLKRTTELLSGRTELLEQYQTKNVSLNQQLAQLIQTNNTQAAQVDGLTLANRTLKEQLVDTQGQLAIALTNGPETGDPPIDASPKVLASVTGLKDIDGIKIVQLNVGANDQIRENTTFVIYRNGDELVGTAVVKSVDQNASVAQLQTITLPVRVGDSAMSGLY